MRLRRFDTRIIPLASIHWAIKHCKEVISFDISAHLLLLLIAATVRFIVHSTRWHSDLWVIERIEIWIVGRLILISKQHLVMLLLWGLLLLQLLLLRVIVGSHAAWIHISVHARRLIEVVGMDTRNTCTCTWAATLTGRENSLRKGATDSDSQSLVQAVYWAVCVTRVWALQNYNKSINIDS
jgi:hypothetical protein